MPVYMIQAGKHGPIKIGHTGDIKVRLKSILPCAYDPLELIALIDGGLEEEKSLQDKFADYRRHREWFHPTLPILAWARNHRPDWVDGVPCPVKPKWPICLVLSWMRENNYTLIQAAHILKMPQSHLVGVMRGHLVPDKTLLEKLRQGLRIEALGYDIHSRSLVIES